MKSTKYRFTLITITIILCLSVSSTAEMSRTLKANLIGQPNPALVEIEKVHIIIVPSSTGPAKDGLLWKQLQTELENKLQSANLKIVPLKERISPEIPELKINIDVLKLADNQKYVFRIQTSLARPVRLAKEPTLLFKADVWKINSTIQAVSIPDAPAKITDTVLQQAEAFIHSYLAANPKPSQPADANNLSVTSQTIDKPVNQSQPNQYKYVASRYSPVFHRPNCPWAKKIKPENLVGYKTREQAIKQGKRPCKVCKP